MLHRRARQQFGIGLPTCNTTVCFACAPSMRDTTKPFDGRLSRQTRRWRPRPTQLSRPANGPTSLSPKDSVTASHQLLSCPKPPRLAPNLFSTQVRLTCRRRRRCCCALRSPARHQLLFFPHCPVSRPVYPLSTMQAHPTWRLRRRCRRALRSPARRPQRRPRPRRASSRARS